MNIGTIRIPTSHSHGVHVFSPIFNMFETFHTPLRGYSIPRDSWRYHCFWIHLLNSTTLSATARSRQATLNHVYLHPLVGAAFLSPSLGDWNHQNWDNWHRRDEPSIFLSVFFKEKNRKINWFSTSNPSPQKENTQWRSRTPDVFQCPIFHSRCSGKDI